MIQFGRKAWVGVIAAIAMSVGGCVALRAVDQLAGVVVGGALNAVNKTLSVVEPKARQADAQRRAYQKEIERQKKLLQQQNSKVKRNYNTKKKTSRGDV